MPAGRVHAISLVNVLRCPRESKAFAFHAGRTANRYHGLQPVDQFCQRELLYTSGLRIRLQESLMHQQSLHYESHVSADFNELGRARLDVIGRAVAHPALGSDHIEEGLAIQFFDVSAVTVNLVDYLTARFRLALAVKRSAVARLSTHLRIARSRSAVKRLCQLAKMGSIKEAIFGGRSDR
jgi:hypothetical protein